MGRRGTNPPEGVLTVAEIEVISQNIIILVKNDLGVNAYPNYAMLNPVDKLLIQQKILDIYDANRGDMPDKTTHYNRNLPNAIPDSTGNIDLPNDISEAVPPVWKELGKEEGKETQKARYHQNNLIGGPNRKFVEIDLEYGKTEQNPEGTSVREVVFYADGTVNSTPEDMGTYNFGKAITGPDDLSHNMEDVFPYYLLGNTPNDYTTLFERLVLLNKD